MGLDGLDPDLVEPLDEEFAVLGVDNRLDGRTEHLHAVFVEDARAVEFHAAVEGCLPAEGEQDTVGTLFGNDFLNEIGRNGFEINLVRHAFRGLDGGDIGVDKHGAYPLLAQGFERLRTRIVELARLTDFECPRTENKHLFYVV